MGGTGNPHLTKPPVSKDELLWHCLHVSVGDLNIVDTKNIDRGLVFRGDGHVPIFFSVCRERQRCL